jgi:hypothetical protein
MTLMPFSSMRSALVLPVPKRSEISSLTAPPL